MVENKVFIEYVIFMRNLIDLLIKYLNMKLILDISRGIGRKSVGWVIYGRYLNSVNVKVFVYGVWSYKKIYCVFYFYDIEG